MSARTDRVAAPIRTLVVDDDAVAARLHARYVAAQEGFVVTATVGSGSAALQVVSTTPVDLLLLDINLPGASGIEVLRRLRTAGAQGVDVIVVSSARDRVTVRQALSGNVVGYLIKPFTQDALAERLQRYRRERGRLDAAWMDSFGQGEIDGLLAHTRELGGPRRAPLDGPLPKGLARPTLDRVLGSLDLVHARTVEEIAEATGTSRATVHRYLQYLHGGGVVDVAHRYGRRGRPVQLYRLAPASG